jgi:hypothetical protein
MQPTKWAPHSFVLRMSGTDSVNYLRRYGDSGNGNILLARIGSSDDGSTGVGGSGTSTGKGVYSSSSSSIDSTGKVTYSANAGRI